jgi:hypothetical protein
MAERAASFAAALRSVGSKALAFGRAHPTTASLLAVSAIVLANLLLYVRSGWNAEAVLFPNLPDPFPSIGQSQWILTKRAPTLGGRHRCAAAPKSVSDRFAPPRPSAAPLPEIKLPIP